MKYSKNAILSLLLFLLLSLSIFADSVQLTWEASPTAGALYQVYRALASGAYDATPLNSSPLSSLTYVDATAQPGVQYFYIVKAKGVCVTTDDAGAVVSSQPCESAPSNEVSVALSARITSCADGQWLAEYYQNITLSAPLIASRCEPSINNVWGGAGPSGVLADSFSVRWSGNFTFAAGAYTFTMTSDDGMRVYLDGSLILNDWTNHGATAHAVTQNITAGAHKLIVEYYENGGDATAQFSWAQQSVQPPANLNITILKPTNGQLLPRGTTPVQALASGNVTKVQLYRGTTLLATVNGSSLNYGWKITRRGTYTLTAKATDSGGKHIASSITVTVN